MFAIEDEIHAEQMGEYPDRDAALDELRRCADLPWDQQPNLAPCTGWRACGRNYELIEYDTATSPWREVSRVRALAINADGADWHL